MRNIQFLKRPAKLAVIAAIIIGSWSATNIMASSKGAAYLAESLSRPAVAAATTQQSAEAAKPAMKCDQCKETQVATVRSAGKGYYSTDKQPTVMHQCADCQEHIVMIGSGKTAQFQKVHSCSHMKTDKATCCSAS
jgi:hypothetical protein